MSFKNKAKFAAIKATSIVLGTVYVASKMVAEGSKNLEANIIHKLDECSNKQLIRRHRMESYFHVQNQLNSFKEQVDDQTQLIKVKLSKRAIANQFKLIDHNNYAN